MKPELIVHIGQGKTGTSSIQYTLAKSQGALLKNDYKYLGYNLNESNSFSENTDYFNGQDLKKIENSQLYLNLVDELSSAKNRGLKLIWSNERLFSSMVSVEIIKKIEALGYKVTIVVYVRRHDLWAKSAYTQWGIKHKFYKGPVQSYNKWRKQFSLKYSSHLLRWKNTFPENFIIRNFDVIKDTAADFLELLNIENIKLHQTNHSPSNETLYVWSIFNSLNSSTKHPDEFESLLTKVNKLYEGFSNKKERENILPSKENILNTYIDNIDDIQKVNKILKDYGQPMFSNDFSQVKDPDLNNDVLIDMMLKFIFSQQNQINFLLNHIKNDEE